jgi:hypothetical protein
MDDSREWQPVIFIEAHNDGKGHAPYNTRAWATPTDPDPNFVAYYRSLGCDSKRFFLLSPKPEACVNFDPVLGVGLGTVCEHEILAD